MMNQTQSSKRFTTCQPVSQKRDPSKVMVLDPTFRSGLLEIPLQQTYPTKGRDEWLAGRLKKDLSICCLFQKSRCHAQERCFQVHVDRRFMTALREQQARIVSCCQRCHDTGSTSSQAMNFLCANIPSATTLRIVNTNNRFHAVDSTLMAYTAGLVQQFEEHGAVVSADGMLDIPARRVCRLHLLGRCKYGKDCKNVHLCTKLGEGVLTGGEMLPVKAEPVLRELPRFSMVEAPEVNRQVPPLSTFSCVVPPSAKLPDANEDISVFENHRCSTTDPLDAHNSSGRILSFSFSSQLADGFQTPIAKDGLEEFVQEQPARASRHHMMTMGDHNPFSEEALQNSPNAFNLKLSSSQQMTFLSIIA